MLMLNKNFFDKEVIPLAISLLGKIIRVKYENLWLASKIIETEAYAYSEKGSHASLGYTNKRKALFMSPGTIYMYYAHGGDSLNISAKGAGNAVLIKSGYIHIDKFTAPDALKIMQQLNCSRSNQPRPIEKLCSGQTLLCKSLGLKVANWDQQQFSKEKFYICDINYQPTTIIQAPRLGIPLGRDEHLLYRFIDFDYSKFCTANPLTKRSWQCNKDYIVNSYEEFITKYNIQKI